MAKNQGWWELKITGNTTEELTMDDIGHITEAIEGGFTSGEIVEDEKE